MAYVQGSNNSETLAGTSANDILDALGGDDKLIGGSGADSLYGGEGEDTASYITSLSGVFVMLFAPLNNSGDAFGDTYSSVENLEGTNYSDSLYADDGNSKVYGLGGSDTLYGADGINYLYGGDGEDNLVGGPGIDFFDGGNGPDEWSYFLSTVGVTVSMDNPAINTGWAAGDTGVNMERVIGSQHDDILYGDSNGNNVWGLGGNDYLYGGGGYDSVIGDDGADYMDGGPGGNLLDYETAPVGLTASLADPSINTGHARGDIYVNFRDLAGSAFPDMLYGDDGPNNFLGLDGNDSIFGAGGDDIIQGQGGGDFMDGQAGFDWAAYDSSVTAILANPSSNTGIAAGDTYASIEGLIGSPYADVLGAAVSGTSIACGPGDDQSFGNVGVDHIFGEDGGDFLVGGADDDRLFGGSGQDYLRGDEGTDRLKGEDGADLIVGGPARDFMTGGDGRDTFDFDQVDESDSPRVLRDQIADFDRGLDRIDLSTIDSNENRAGDQSFRFVRKEGADFTHKAGRLTWEYTDKKGTSKDATIVHGDTDGNGKADFAIKLDGLIKLSVDDFLL